MPLVAVVVALALAHPGARTAGGGPARLAIGHRAILTVDPGAVELDYVCEIPAITLYGEARRAGAGGDYVTAKLEELGTGLQVTWDGAPLPLERVEVAEPAKEGEEDFLDLRVVRRAALPRTAGTVALRNGNYPDDEAYYATEVRVSGDLVVTASSLARVREGRLRDNRHGAWQREEAGREPSVTVRPARWWERRDGRFPMPERMEGLVEPSPLAHGVFVAAGTIGLFGVAWLGRRLGAMARRA
ncbi:MAG: hypothetical protein ACOZNI_18650 [Myxococcota bacterium]